MADTFTAWICVLPIKPNEPNAHNKRRHPLVHNELFLTREEAAEWAYFEGVDDPAPDKVSWQVIEVHGVTEMRNYLGDEPLTPLPADQRIHVSPCLFSGKHDHGVCEAAWARKASPL